MIQDFLSDNKNVREEKQEQAEKSSFLGKLQRFIIVCGIIILLINFIIKLFV